MHKARISDVGCGVGRMTLAAAVFALAFCATGAARASVISSTPDPLPPGALLVGTGGGAGCFPTAMVCSVGGTLSYSNVTSSIVGPNQVLDFDASLTAPFTDLSMTHLLGTVTLTGTGSETVFGRTSASELGTFSTQITSLDLTGVLDGVQLQVTQDTDNASTGSTMISPVGDRFEITSFFDIFIDIELATSPPLMTGRGPLHAVLEAVPEPPGIALILLPLAVLLAVGRPRASYARA